MSIAWTKMEELLTRLLEISEDTGEATDGSTTTLEDTGKNWATDMWAEATVHILIGDVEYVSTVASNTADTLTFTAIGTAVLAGCQYSLKKSINIQDIVRWGGTDLTGRDISLDLKAITDDSIKGLLKSIGDIAALENLITRIGQTSDAVVAAGAEGSASAKLRRLTTDLNALITQLSEDLGDKTSPDAGSLNARVGEVQASPTSNTLLDRLKTIATDIGTLTTQLSEDIGDKTTPDAGSINARLGEVQASPTANTLLARLKDLSTLIGEVQASPTENTVLDRLKDITTAIGTLTPAAGTPVIYNVTMTNAATEYSQALPANTKRFTVHCRDGTAFRLAFATGKVATPTEPYLTVPSSSSYDEDNINPASLTIYIGCAIAGKVVEIVAWS